MIKGEQLVSIGLFPPIFLDKMEQLDLEESSQRRNDRRGKEGNEGMEGKPVFVGKHLVAPTPSPKNHPPNF